MRMRMAIRMKGPRDTWSTSSYLFFPVLILLLELPVDQGTLRLWAALQESTAVLYAIDDLLFQPIPAWVICREP